jgi:sulfate transport system ATP-binding protein
MTIEVRKLSKLFDRFQALNAVDLRIEPGELVALVGPSGSGKTTLLRIIAGLEQASAGQVLFDDHDASDRPIHQRQVGFVFQHYALFRHMTVFENVAFGLRVKPRHERPSRAAIREKVERLLRLVQIDHLARRYPTQLSGGQRQRAALARALAVEPRILLLDEPFGALDAKVRKELRVWLRRLHDEMGLTSVFVTHDQDEALELADRVVVMSQGRIEQAGAPEEVYDRPATPFVSEFMGDTNRLEVPVVRGQAQLWGHTAALSGPAAEAKRALIYIRPQDLELGAAAFAGAVPVEIRQAMLAGAMIRVVAAAPALPGQSEPQSLDVLVHRQAWRALALAPGDRAFLTIRHHRAFPAG